MCVVVGGWVWGGAALPATYSNPGGIQDQYSYYIAAPKGLDVYNLAPYVDSFNIMAYDFHGAWETITNHHMPWADPQARALTAALAAAAAAAPESALAAGSVPPASSLVAPIYSPAFPSCLPLLSQGAPHPRHPQTVQGGTFDIIHALDHFINVGKAPPAKVALGLATYGRSWKLNSPPPTGTVALPGSPASRAGPMTKCAGESRRRRRRPDCQPAASRASGLLLALCLAQLLLAAPAHQRASELTHLLPSASHPLDPCRRVWLCQLA